MYNLLEARSNRYKEEYDDSALTGRTSVGWKNSKGKNTLSFRLNTEFMIKRHSEIMSILESDELLEDLNYPEYSLDMPYAPSYKESTNYYGRSNNNEIDTTKLNLITAYSFDWSTLATNIKFCSMNNFLNIINKLNYMSDSDCIDKVSTDLLKAGVIKTNKEGVYIFINDSEFDFDKCGFFFADVLSQSSSSLGRLSYNNYKNFCYPGPAKKENIKWRFIINKDESPFVRVDKSKALSGSYTIGSLGESGNLKCSLVKDTIKTTKTGDDFLDYMKSKKSNLMNRAESGVKRANVTVAKSGLVMNSITEWLLRSQVKEIFEDYNIEFEDNDRVTLSKEGYKNSHVIIFSHILPTFNSSSQAIQLCRYVDQNPEISLLLANNNDVDCVNITFKGVLHKFVAKDMNLTKTKYLEFKERSSFKYVHNFIKFSLLNISSAIKNIELLKEEVIDAATEEL